MKCFKILVAMMVVGLSVFAISTFAQDDEDAFLDDMLSDQAAANGDDAVQDAEDDLDALLGGMDADEDEAVQEEAVQEEAIEAAAADEAEDNLNDLLDSMDSEEGADAADAESDAEMELEVAEDDSNPPEAVAVEEAGPSPKELEQQRIVELQAAEEEGKLKLKEAQELIDKRRYEQALTALRSGISKMPERPANDDLLKQAQQKIVDVQLKMASQSLDREDYETARTQLSNVRTSLESVGPDYAADAEKQIGRLQSIADRQEESFQRASTPEALQIARIEEDEDTVDGLIDSGKRMMRLGKYDEAERYFKRALNIDVYNKDAMRLLKKVDATRFRISTIEREATVNQMVQEVRQTWNPPIKLELEAPRGIDSGRERYGETETQELRKKMDAIVIPSIEFRQANIVDVIEFLREASAAADPDGVGVNIISKIPQGRMSGGGGGGAEADPDPFGGGGEAADPWADFSFDEQPTRGGAGGGGTESSTTASTIPTITLNLRRVSLMDAIKYVTEVAGLKYRLEKNVVIITPADAVEGQVITRMYPVQPSFLDIVVTRSDDDQNRRGGGGGGQFIEMGSSPVSMEKSDVKEFFVNSGVKFPAGTSITYNKGISQLIVSNTPENLEVFESILAQLNVIPKQVEIETRFVEVAQNDLEEIGFEWLLNDNYEMLVKNGSGPIGGRERFVMNANRNTGGFTSGLRFFDQSESGLSPVNAATGPLGGMGSILGISSVLTNPEVSMILHALDQKGGSDLLSAPRVTTRSGVNAEIKVVREIIYPTEFDNEVQNVETTDDQGRRINSRQIIVTPEGFETRETGVIMNVTPTVGPDGYTIDLSMIPEVVELIDWIQYGTEDYNMPQPIFSKRTVATSIIIWDGQTVVMGGMIREQITTVDDKIPFLGDIPLVGRLFKNKGEYSQKQNLLIFVTARLVDPAGNRIRKPGEQVPGQPTS